MDSGDGGVLTVVGLLGEGSAAGEKGVEEPGLFGCGVLRRRGGQSRRKGQQEHKDGGQHGHGLDQGFHIHPAFPPLTAPKRTGGRALSSAQAQAFISRMA